ncbi:hypothetical protein MUCCIDRAFT_71996 [Mucor lusitanicus CBS 277.49]|uniref:Uncharacterized protein n=1 Tax=Mucor lusitanicus CBS 277.49 TaxID=747725 RepID=A0A162TVD3_MUCCL|nr:hypothetical protein MUCCIDRAFT_71996 [Mucor lusitanicus CBS 277.49]
MLKIHTTAVAFTAIDKPHNHGVIVYHLLPSHYCALFCLPTFADLIVFAATTDAPPIKIINILRAFVSSHRCSCSILGYILLVSYLLCVRDS